MPFNVSVVGRRKKEKIDNSNRHDYSNKHFRGHNNLPSTFSMDNPYK